MATVRAYGPGVLSLLAKEINWTSDTIKVALIGSGYTPDQDTHRYFSSVVASEASGTGYSAGGVTLASKTITYSSGTNTVTLDCADPTWGGTSITYRYAVFYVSTGTDATSPLLAYVDLGATTTSSENIQLVIPTAGLLQYVVA